MTRSSRRASSLNDAAPKGLAALGSKLPAACDVMITNVCNAACGFCGFSREKGLIGPRRYLDAGALVRALPILHRRGIRYMTLLGGEPLVHPDIVDITAAIVSAGMKCTLVTNGWFLSRDIDALAGAGLGAVLISIDSADLIEHERNRGLPGLSERLKEAIASAHRLGVPAHALVTVNRLVDYDALPGTLQRLGLDAVHFSYPRHEPLGSTSLVYGGGSDLVDLDRDELLEALAAIRRLKKRYPVFNPAASIAEVERFVRGERQLVPCVGGYKYFFLDWNLDIWRCEAWSKPMGSVFDLERLPDQREPCNECMMGCYRNASMFMHAGVAATDALRSLATGDIRSAASSLFRRSVLLSLWSVISEIPQLRRASRRTHRPPRRGREGGDVSASPIAGDGRRLGRSARSS